MVWVRVEVAPGLRPRHGREITQVGHGVHDELAEVPIPALVRVITTELMRTAVEDAERHEVQLDLDLAACAISTAGGKAVRRCARARDRIAFLIDRVDAEPGLHGIPGSFVLFAVAQGSHPRLEDAAVLLGGEGLTAVARMPHDLAHATAPPVCGQGEASRPEGRYWPFTCAYRGTLCHNAGVTPWSRGPDRGELPGRVRAMPTRVAPEHELVEMSLPLGLRGRMDALISRLRQRMGDRAPDSRGDLVELLISWLEEAEDLEAELQSQREELQRLREEAEAAMRRRDEALATLEAADREIRYRVDVAQEALQLLAAAHERGISRADILDAAELCLSAGVPPRRIVQALRDSGAPSLLAWADRLASAVAQAQARVNALREEAAAAKRARQQAQAEAEEVLREAEAQVQQAQERVRRVEQHVELLQATAAELGAYVDFLRLQGRVDDLPAMVGRVLAGVVLLAAIDAHGDAVLRLPAGGPASRLIEVPVALSEIPYLLAPREAYTALREAQAARSARARAIAQDGTRAPVGGAQEGGDTSA